MWLREFWSLGSVTEDKLPCDSFFARLQNKVKQKAAAARTESKSINLIFQKVITMNPVLTQSNSWIDSVNV